MPEYPDHNRCPREVIESFCRYIRDGVPLGDFLAAVVCDKLVESFKRADSENMAAMGHIVSWVYNFMPIDLRGPENYRAHLNRKSEERLRGDQA
jgi:hypothetical protein